MLPDPRSSSALRIALVASPMKAVPPVGYGGTERVVAALASVRGVGGPARHNGSS